MNYDKIFSYSVTAILLGLAGYHQSAPFAYAAVLSGGINALYDVYNRLLALREQKPVVSEEVRRTLHDINARVATLEYGVKQRGF